MNQSQDVDNPITERNPITQETQDFSPEVHVLAGALILVVSTKLGGSAAKRCCTNLVHIIGHRKNLPTSEVTQ
jgi:hypothetical protein